MRGQRRHEVHPPATPSHSGTSYPVRRSRYARIVSKATVEETPVRGPLLGVQLQGAAGEPVFDESQEQLYQVWMEVMNAPEAADRTRFSFCVTRFIELGEAEPADDILNVLSRLPHVSDHTSRYLRSVLEDRDVLERVLKFLRSRSNQWTWQEYRLATLFWHAPHLSREQLQFVRRRAASGNTYWAARNVYFEAVPLRLIARVVTERGLWSRGEVHRRALQLPAHLRRGEV